MNKLPECERPSVSLLACTRAQHATPQPKRSADCPRSRGVYQADDLTLGFATGSSPLARGLRASLANRLTVLGIIPARAGFTLVWPPGSRGTGDHPRSRGVYVLQSRTTTMPRGSSPLARGLLGNLHMEESMSGIIPARAGFTCPPFNMSSNVRDHPRSRGVYPAFVSLGILGAGSSPLARGLLTPSK